MTVGNFSLTDSTGMRASNARHRTSIGLGAAATLLLGILTFMPYPAIPFGNQGGLQLGNLLSLLLLVPALALPWRHRPIFLSLLILAPLVLSAINVGLSQSGSLDLCVKNIVIWGILCATLIATQLYATRYGLHLLTGIAIITLVHVAVGIWQIYCFSLNEFPFVGFYVNQSFLSVQDNADIIARYIRRPFGLFPEPSAMSSSLAPWVLFWVAELCGVVRLREQPARWQRILFGLAAAGGLGLIILSSSGHTVVTLAGLFFIGALWFRKLRATPRTFGIVLSVLLVVLPLIFWSAWVLMSNRIEGEYHTSGSWDDRSGSMIAGFYLYAQGGFSNILFGIGTGLSPDAIWNVARYEAVFSLLLSYLFETGLFGAIAILWIGAHLLRVWRATGLNAAYITIAIVWVVGITITTDYAQLLPIWVALGWLTIWPAVCVSAKEDPLRSSTERSQQDPRHDNRFVSASADRVAV